MTQKRKNVSTSDDPEYSKRLRPSYFDGGDDKHNTTIAPQPRLDSTYGQRGAFPGLDDLSTKDALFYGPASDGLEYLQMVRSEAKGVPNLLVAPASPTAVVAAELHADHEQGYYADGAYTAVPNITIPKTGGVKDEDLDPQEAYYASLCSRFAALSSTLRATPPIVAAQAVSAAEQVHKSICSSPAKWRRHLLNTQPTMTLLSQLQHEDVVQGLRILETVLTRANLERRESVGAWAWGLLARCREIGEMVSEEVGVLRDLGKKAIGVIRAPRDEVEEDDEDERLSNGDDKDGEDDYGAAVEDEGPALNTLPADVEDEPPAPSGNSISFADNEATDTIISAALPSDSTTDPLAPARQRLLDLLEPAAPTPTSPNTTTATTATTAANPSTPPATHQAAETPAHHQSAQAPGTTDQDEDDGPETSLRANGTLDMIITVVGEFYGQKDLLNARLLWDEML